MYQFVNYQELIEREGKTFLFDRRTYEARCGQLTELRKTYDEIRRFLSDNDFSTNEGWVEAVAKDGADGIRKLLVKEVETDAKRLKLSSRVAEKWKRESLNELSKDVQRTANELRTAVVNLSEGLPPFSYFDADTTIDAQIRSGCEFEITDRIRSEASQVIELAGQIRKLELDGLNAVELTSKYARTDHTPEDLQLFRDVATRRHRNGIIAPADITAFVNLQPIKN